MQLLWQNELHNWCIHGTSEHTSRYSTVGDCVHVDASHPRGEPLDILAHFTFVVFCAQYVSLVFFCISFTKSNFRLDAVV